MRNKKTTRKKSRKSKKYGRGPDDTIADKITKIIETKGEIPDLSNKQSDKNEENRIKKLLLKSSVLTKLLNNYKFMESLNTEEIEMIEDELRGINAFLNDKLPKL
jgi:hypothetical protein